MGLEFECKGIKTYSVRKKKITTLQGQRERDRGTGTLSHYIMMDEGCRTG